MPKGTQPVSGGIRINFKDTSTQFPLFHPKSTLYENVSRVKAGCKALYGPVRGLPLGLKLCCSCSVEILSHFTLELCFLSRRRCYSEAINRAAGRNPRLRAQQCGRLRDWPGAQCASARLRPVPGGGART